MNKKQYLKTQMANLPKYHVLYIGQDISENLYHLLIGEQHRLEEQSEDYSDWYQEISAIADICEYPGWADL